MNIIACIVVGIIAGWIAERLMGRDHGLITNLIVGIVGAMIGGFLISNLLGLRYDEGFNLATVGVATLGAVVLLAILGGGRRILGCDDEPNNGRGPDAARGHRQADGWGV